MNDSRTAIKPGTLYVVATPIGNRDDITLRALGILAAVDLIAAEDTRDTRRFLERHHIKSRFISYHEHNEKERTPRLVAQLKNGTTIALVSNAGTPCVSDPGYRLIRAAITNDVSVVPIPGVSAAAAALSVAGLPTDAFTFVGFLSKKKGKRLKELTDLARQPRTLIFFESPRRIAPLLQEILDTIGNRPGVLAREMTKLHEEFIRGPLTDILKDLQGRADVKGECTLLVGGYAKDSAADWETIKAEIRRALEPGKQPASRVAREIADRYEIPKNRVYAEAIRIGDRIAEDRKQRSENRSQKTDGK